jgi:ketosteroid isomerase-like protein
MGKIRNIKRGGCSSGAATTARGGSGGWQELFDTHELLRNVRETKKVEVSEQGDGAFAVVDIDTLWRGLAGDEMRWKGRVCKVYSKVGGEWKMTMHTGVLVYP